MVAGALYGTVLGSCIVFLGACLGAEISFLLGRTLLRNWVQRRMADFPKLQVVQKAVSREGLKLILLTRLSPVFPFSLLNFAYGLSDVSFRDYLIGLLAIAPGTIEVPSYFEKDPSYERDFGNSLVPWGRVGLPEEVGYLADYLVSDL